MSADLTISPVLSASSFAKMTLAGTSAEAGDAFGQMLLGVQNAAAGGDPGAALTALAGDGVAGRGVACVGVAGGDEAVGAAVARQSMSADPVPNAGHAGNQVTNMTVMAAAGAASRPSVPGLVAVGKAALDQVTLVEPVATGGHVDATPAAGIVGAPRADAANAPEAVAAVMSGGSAMPQLVADQPAAVPVAGGVPGQAIAGSPVADAQPLGLGGDSSRLTLSRSGSLGVRGQATSEVGSMSDNRALKHAKVAMGRNGAGGRQAAVPLAEGAPTAAAETAAALTPQALELPVDENRGGPTAASVSGAHAPAPAVRSNPDGLVHTADVISGSSDLASGPISGARVGGSGPGALTSGTGATGDVRDLAAGTAPAVPSTDGGRGSAGVSSGVDGTAQPAPLGGAGPADGAAAGAAAAVDVAAVRAAGSVVSASAPDPGIAGPPPLTSALAAQLSGGAFVGGVSAAIPADARSVAAVGAGGVQLGGPGSGRPGAGDGALSTGGAERSAGGLRTRGAGLSIGGDERSTDGAERSAGGGAPGTGAPGRSGGGGSVDVVAPASSDAADMSRVPSIADSGVVPDISTERPVVSAPSGDAVRVADAATRVARSDLNASAVGAGLRGPGTRGGVAEHVTSVAAPVGKPVQAAPARAARVAPAPSLDTTAQHGAAAPVENVRSGVAVAAPDVTIRAAAGTRAVSSDAAPRPAGLDSAASVDPNASGIAALGLPKASDVNTGIAADRIVLPSDTGKAPVVQTAIFADAESARAVAAGAVQSGAVPAVAAPVSGPVPDVAAPVVTAGTAAGRPTAGSAAHTSMAADAPMAADAHVPTPADAAVQSPPLPSAVSVMTPVDVEDFGAASDVVPQASVTQGTAGLASGLGRAGVREDSPPRVAPRATTADRQMQWLPAIDRVGVASPHPETAATVGAAGGGGSGVVRASGTDAAAGQRPATVQVASVPAAMAAPEPGAEMMPADARTGGTPVADHKIALHAAGAQPDPVPPAVPVALPEQVLPASAPSAQPVDPPVAAAAQGSSPVRLPEPAEQVGPALLTLAKTPEGAQEMIVRMQPAELGMVQVRITRAGSGTTQIDITAEKTGTLLALQRDQVQLHRTLDEAGISAIGRTITIHAAPVAQVASGDSAPGLGGHPGGQQTGGQQAGGQQGQGGRGNTGSADADGGGDRGGFSGREANGYAGGRRSGGASELVAANANVASRAGLDITA